MAGVDPSSNEDEEKKRAEINDVVEALHTMYEVVRLPAIQRLKLLHRHIDDDDDDDDNEDDDDANWPEFEDDTIVKSTASAIKFKTIADGHFCRGEYEYASLAYTKCLLFAEEGSEQAGHAYANRSAALFKMGKYRQCRLDVDRALGSNYPEDKKQKLRERKDRCSSLMGEQKPFSSEVTNESSAVDPVKAGGQEESDVAATKSLREELDAEWSERCDPLTNPLIRRASNKVKIACDETWGRHLIATENIKAGEVLTCERYFVFILSSHLKYKHCSYCGNPCDALIPCPSCSQVMYCSTYCRVRAFNLYHRTECQFFRCKEMREEVIDNDLVAFRLLLVGTDQGAGLRTLMSKLTKWDLFAEKIDPTDKPFKSDYLNVLRTCRTFERPLLNFTSKPGLIAKIIIRLRDVGYFDSCPNQRNVRPQKGLTDVEEFTALLLHNHLISIRLNTFAPSKFLQESDIRRNAIGVGVCVLNALVNHSCDPNSCFITRNLENVIHSARPISKGEQITIGYSEQFTLLPLNERQDKLSNPFGNCRFTCICEACDCGWPTYSGLYEIGETFVGPNFKRARYNFLRIILPVTANCVSTLSRKELLQLIIRLSDWFHINLDRPSIAALDCQALLANCMKYFYDTSRDENTTDFLMMKRAENSLSDIASYVHKFWK